MAYFANHCTDIVLPNSEASFRSREGFSFRSREGFNYFLGIVYPFIGKKYLSPFKENYSIYKHFHVIMQTNSCNKINIINEPTDKEVDKEDAKNKKSTDEEKLDPEELLKEMKKYKQEQESVLQEQKKILSELKQVKNKNNLRDSNSCNM